MPGTQEWKISIDSVDALAGQLSANAAAITSEATTRGSQIGTLSSLNTTAKSNIVAAVSEVKTQANSNATNITSINGKLGDQFANMPVPNNITTSIVAVDSLANNAYDLAVEAATKTGSNITATTFRTNLDVYSKSETGSQITAAMNAHLAGYGEYRGKVADITARNALTTATISAGDTVKVEDDGDGKWALYRAVVDGSVITWEKENDEDGMYAGMSAAQIKTSYESNANTNAFTDAEKSKVGHISVTSNINLDNVVETSELITILDSAATDTQVPSAKAVVTLAVNSVTNRALTTGSNLSASDVTAFRTKLNVYDQGTVDTMVAGAGSNFKLDAKTVSNDKIVLTYAPKDAFIMNYSSAQYFDVATNTVKSIPLVLDSSDATGKTYTLQLATPGSYNTKTVYVEYPYQAA